MATIAARIQHGHNWLLDRISVDDAAQFAPYVEETSLGQGAVIARVGDALTHCYFPTSAVFSVVHSMSDGSAVEVGAIGREGFLGIGMVLGVAASPHQVIAQIPGHAYRIPSHVLAEASANSCALRSVLHQYACAYMEQTALIAACNLRHDIEQRCVRWLLMTHERLGGGDTIRMNHEHLAIRLGVRRSGVTVATGKLQALGLITTRRGVIQISDRAGLVARACECYEGMRDCFLGILPLRTHHASPGLEPVTVGDAVVADVWMKHGAANRLEQRCMPRSVREDLRSVRVSVGSIHVTTDVVSTTDRTDEELQHLARIPEIRAEIRTRIEPLCRHMPQDALDRMLDDMALVRYRSERSFAHSDLNLRRSSV